MKALRRILLTAALMGGLAAAPVQAAPSDTAPRGKTVQQERMASCNKQATGKTGEDRKAFMSECLRGDTTSDGKALTPAQERMRSCNADATAKGLKGDERRNFMSTCLKAN